MRAATPVEILSAPSPFAGPPGGTRRCSPTVAFGGLIERTKLRFPTLRCRLFPWRNHANHFAGRYPVYVVARTYPVRFRDSPRQSHLVFGCNLSHACFRLSVPTIAGSVPCSTVARPKQHVRTLRECAGPANLAVSQWHEGVSGSGRIGYERQQSSVSGIPVNRVPMNVNSIAEQLFFTTVRIDTITQTGAQGSGTGFFFAHKRGEQDFPFVVTINTRCWG